MTRSDNGRPVPSHIITEDYTDDEEIGLLKSGKEADVHLVRRHGPDRSCLLAAKRYRPVEQRAFRNDAIYRAHRRIDGLVRDGDRLRRPKGGRSTQLAMDQRTTYGRKVLAERWIEAEYETLKTLWAAGGPVPFPIQRLDDGMLMEFVGSEVRAAPRLVDARVPRNELAALFEQVRDALLVFTRAGIVHGDLSPFNILVWDGRIWVIDFPQAAAILATDHATDLLHRDVVNVTAWFARKGLAVDENDMFVQMVNEMFDLQMSDMFKARE